MEAAPILPFLIAIFVSLPLMTGWVAKGTGRNFWLWTFLTCILPGITMIALFILPDIKKQSDKKLSDF
jgi:hypothetical protein